VKSLRRHVLFGLLLLAVPGDAAPRVRGWDRFGFDAARSNAGPRKTGITAANVASLVRQQIALDGTADSSPIYLAGVIAGGSVHDVFVVTTSYGKTIAVDAASGTVLWRFTPGSYDALAGSAQITQSSPIADPGRTWIYAASPDGFVHKLAVASGTEAPGWPVAVTRDATHEKIGTALNLSRGLLLVTTGGYIGDAPPYQGHVVSIDAETGRIVHVWNALCSDRAELLDPTSCPESDAAIWARAGAVVDPATGNLLVATGNAFFDGRQNWGDSVLMLSPDAGQLLQSWTPTDQAELNVDDADLGSTAPAVIAGRLAVQGGKDGKLRVLSLRRLNGRTRTPGSTGGELTTVMAPGGGAVLTTPAVWRHGRRTWLFVANGRGTTAFLTRNARLAGAWQNDTAGTSPVVAGGLLWVYDPSRGGLNVYQPTSGRLVATLPAGRGHWSSPIVIDGRVALPEGDANAHATTGVLDVYRLP